MVSNCGSWISRAWLAPGEMRHRAEVVGLEDRARHRVAELLVAAALIGHRRS